MFIRNALLAASLSILFAGAASAHDLSNSINHVPVLGNAATTTASVGQQYRYAPAVTDADGDTLSFVVKNRPSWLNFSYQSGSLTGTPSKAGTFADIEIFVKDTHSTKSLGRFTIVVASTNSAPKIVGSPLTAGAEGQAYSFQPSATDSNGDALGFSIQNKPSWASFSTATGKLSGTPVAGAYSNILISVSDGKASASLPSFGIAVSGGSSNTAPKISGSPMTALNIDSPYSFQPSASDSNGDALSFSVANKPSWASFNSTTGKLSGTPSAADVGTYSNIVVSVSDGKTSAALPAFSIAVNQISFGSVALSWTAPTQNTDGTSLNNLAGYRVVYGTSPSALNQSVQVNAGVSSIVVDNLAPATYYFAVRAFTTAGLESTNSNVATKVLQ